MFGLGKPDVNKLESRRDINGLVKALDYKNDTIVRQNAIKALAKIGGDSVVGSILTAFNDRDAQVRCEAARAFKTIRNSRAIDPLKKLLRDEEPSVRACAAETLKSMNWIPGNDELSARFYIVISDWDKCADLGAIAVDPLMSVLNNLDKDDLRRVNIIKALGKTGNAYAIESVIKDPKNFDYLEKVAKAILNEPNPRYIEFLIKLVAEGNKSGLASISIAADYAAKALGKIHDKRVVQLLINYLATDIYLSRATNVVRALAEIGDPSAIEPLVNLLEPKRSRNSNSDRDFHVGVASALEKLQWQPGKDRSGAYYWVWKKNWAKCVEIGSPAVEPLLADCSTHWEAIEALGLIGDKRAVIPLTGAFENIGLGGWEGAKLWYDVSANALARIGDTRAIEPLFKLYTGRYWRAKTVGEAIAILIKKDPQPLIRYMNVNDRSISGDAEKLLRMAGYSGVLNASTQALNNGGSNVIEPASETNHKITAGNTPKLDKTVTKSNENTTMYEYNDDKHLPIKASSGLEPQGMKGSALIDAVRAKNCDSLRELLISGTNPNTFDEDGFTALILAVYTGKTCIIELLIKAGANPNLTDKNNNATLHHAVSLGHKDIVELLIKAGANPNLTDKNSFMALSRAANLGHKDIVELLIKAGSNLDIKDINGRTALIYAVRNRHKDIVELLIKAGSNLDIKDITGCTALIYAASLGHKDIVELLIKSNANLDIQDIPGSTALIYAASLGHKDIVELLIKAKANPNLIDKTGMNALAYSEASGYKDIALIIENASKF
ncbi:hypothetical protein MCP_1774 [Methanocella paludicola SANAE]|uniref:Uncharacterized protein n=1 Tax=Methanocella paludicola (strain DSM 17711 / JCM 13418 / NBRC 101707 / SANAE) TaxID=304371 RepID=D1YZH4_METPS|nr:hypothetical protein MCP_1774 [Methanocella paludicola SANAE]